MIVTLMCANLIIRKIYKDGSPSVKVALSQHYNGSERPCKRFLRVRIYNEGSAVAEGILDRIINNKYSIEVKGRISMRKRHAFSNEESGVNNNG